MGTDLHRLVEGRSLFVGGVELPSDRGALGHSDGDVAMHALTDALLGAVGLGDIGELFPDNDPTLAGIESSTMLAEAVERLTSAGWSIENVDVVVELERPKVRPHRDDMRRTMAAVLGVDVERVFVKAKTGEGLPPIGTGEAIAASAVALVARVAP